MRELDEAFTVLYGDGFEKHLQDLWKSGAPSRTNHTPSWDDPEIHGHLDVHFAMQHEQHHLKHLNASPFGVLLWVLGTECRISSAQLLQKWSGSSSLAKPRLPLYTRYGSDATITQLQEIRQACALFEKYLGFSWEMLEPRTLQTIGQAVAGSLDELLGMTDTFPEIRRQSSDDAFPAEVAGAQFGAHAVLEGLARCNEYTAFAWDFGRQYTDRINRFMLTRAHGDYEVANQLVMRILGIAPPLSFVVTARLADWSLQAPILPCLLRGRMIVGLEELRPGARYLMLLERARRLGVDSVDKLIDSEAKLFAELGWETPTQVAERILALDDVRPRTVLGQFVFEGLKHAADIRARGAQVVLWGPRMIAEANHLISSLGFFKDHRAMLIGSFIGQNSERFFAFFDNALQFSLINDLCEGDDFAESILVARCVEDGTNVDYRTMLGNYFQKLLGERNGSGFLTAFVDN